jgi:outer membrane murein-binding lipoprotein Lpp
LVNGVCFLEKEVKNVMELFQNPENMTILGLMALIIAAAVREFFGWLSKKNIQSSQARYDKLYEGINSVTKKLDKIDEENRVEKISADIKTLNNKVDDLEVDMKKLSKQSEDMYDWHNKSDADGVKVWYVRQSLENALRDNAKATEAIARNIELQTRLLEEMISNQRNLSKEQAEMMKDIRDIERALDDK